MRALIAHHTIAVLYFKTEDSRDKWRGAILQAVHLSHSATQRQDSNIEHGRPIVGARAQCYDRARADSRELTSIRGQQ